MEKNEEKTMEEKVESLRLINIRVSHVFMLGITFFLT